MASTKITVKQFLDQGGKALPGTRVLLPTFSGNHEVGYIRGVEHRDPWAVCPRDNGGHGMSYCVHFGTELLVEEVAP